MLTKSDVANLALGKLGSSLQIVNIDSDSSQTAKIIRRHFDMAYKAVLSQHPWSVYTKQTALTLIMENPSAKWAYAYALPADAMIVRRIALGSLFSDEFEYLEQLLPFEPVNSIDGYQIHTNVPNAWAEYTCTIPDGSGYIEHFGRAFAAQLAIDIAPSIITNNWVKMKDAFLKEAKTEISGQISIDIALSPMPVNADSPFIRARNSRGYTTGWGRHNGQW